jgi:hypothetical protein
MSLIGSASAISDNCVRLSQEHCRFPYPKLGRHGLRLNWQDAPIAFRPSQFLHAAWRSGCQAVTKSMNNRAALNRNIAAEVRAKADNLSDERVRQDLLMAAEVWDRLATLAEKSVPLPLQAYPRQPNA